MRSGCGTAAPVSPGPARPARWVGISARRLRWTPAAIGVGLAGCAKAEAAGGEEASLNGNVAKVEAIEGSPLSKVSLSPEAADRLGIATGVVSRQAVTGHTVVPYSAVIYDANGAPF